MVIKTKPNTKRRSCAPTDTKKDSLVSPNERYTADLDGAEEAEDVIDLGAPQRLRRKSPERLFTAPNPRLRYTYTPNPRLYPGSPAKPKRGSRAKPSGEANRKEVRGRRRKHTFQRPVPNARLYRPAPLRPPPPPVRPRAPWPPPALPVSHLDTASRAALRFSEQRKPVPHSLKRVTRSPGAERPHSHVRTERSPSRPVPRRLVVTLPGAAGGDAPPPYRPASAHFRRQVTSSGESTPAAARPVSKTVGAMDAPAASRHSASPEDRSEGNETLSAPSEFLAEFLSAIMQRQYAEALKYCRLILQYEPHNATARGFYPLLRHKVHVSARPEAEAPRDNSSSESAMSPRASAPAPEPALPTLPVLPALPKLASREDMEQEADESGSEEGSVGSQSSLEMDSSEALANSSASPSLSLSRRTYHTDSETGASVGSLGSSGSAQSGQCTRCRTHSRAPDPNHDPDDNGNEPEPDAAAAHAQCDDLENDNAPAATSRDLKRESSSLRRLRAHFACSIK